MKNNINTKQTVLIFTSIHLPHDSRIVNQAQSLQEAGYSCTLLAPWAGHERNYPFNECYFERKKGILGRILAQLIFLRIVIFHSWNFVHFHDFDTLPAAIVLRLLTWRRIIYDVHENYGEEVMIREYIPIYLRRPLRYIVDVIEWIGALIIGRVVTVVPVQTQRFQRWGVRKIVMVRNYASLKILPSAPVNPIKAQQKGFVICTSGQNTNYGALLILDAVSILARRGSNIPIRGIDRFEGTPGLKDYVLKRIAEEAIHNYKFLPRVEPQVIGSYLNSSAIGLSIYLDTPNKRQAIPTKLFEYMAYGIPIIATNVGYQAEIINKSNAGVLIPANSADALADSITDLWNNPELRAQIGSAGREAFMREYCWEVEVKKLLGFYANPSIFLSQ